MDSICLVQIIIVWEIVKWILTIKMDVFKVHKFNLKSGD